MSFDSALSPHISDAITALTSDSEWTKVADDVEDVIAACKSVVESWYSAMLIGMVHIFVTVPPAGWLEMDGTTFALADYPELSAVLPSGWISGANFTLPDMQDVFISGVGSAGTIAASSGANSYSLAVNQLPAHDHLYTMPVASPDTVGAGAPIPSVMSVAPSTPTSVTGSGATIDNRPANLALVLAVYAGRA